MAVTHVGNIDGFRQVVVQVTHARDGAVKAESNCGVALGFFAASFGSVWYGTAEKWLTGYTIPRKPEPYLLH